MENKSVTKRNQDTSIAVTGRDKNVTRIGRIVVCCKSGWELLIKEIRPLICNGACHACHAICHPDLAKCDKHTPFL